MKDVRHNARAVLVKEKKNEPLQLFVYVYMIDTALVGLSSAWIAWRYHIGTGREKEFAELIRGHLLSIADLDFNKGRFAKLTREGIVLKEWERLGLKEPSMLDMYVRYDIGLFWNMANVDLDRYTDAIRHFYENVPKIIRAAVERDYLYITSFGGENEATTYKRTRMGKHIYITEEQSQLLNEYAQNRKAAFNNFVSSLGQIAQNWCLIRYVQESGDEARMQLLNHWRGELVTQMCNASNGELKENNSFDARLALYSQAWDKAMANSKMGIMGGVDKKFIQERIDLSQGEDWVYAHGYDEWFERKDLVERIKQDFMSSKDDLISMMAVVYSTKDERQKAYLEFVQSL